MKASKVLYKPFGMALGAAGGALAGAVFRKVWKAIGNDDEAPGATDQERGWREIVLAAALQGAIFAAVKAAVDRGGATTVKRLTGSWPA
ncbi:DUF4235 domain-containing protein [Streptomyces sp. CHA1]|uniref:DUF4235 domain-containing protein n=1 Tax=Streptomyces TaxID=1883 RepID=UPI0003131C15|nr:MULTISPECIES: DUF4235 domain-containing protein [Streptomyces]QOZ98347.1 DUF4235 domain-containing protein [Streptomyces violascens]UYM25650.1 DUF4235 domain-containing protein [Streptomyces albus]WDV30710.1 DUF4235 domain-containing protein [Streptomyces sp. AD16]ESQ07362.1 integral membrane protein [Streptomyces sp. PVA_94-07]MBP3076326.1 membrane protein [Streptomyces sp. 604F]